MSENKDKKYKTGQMQDNGLMYDPVYDFNKDGKVDWVEDSVRREEIKRSQERFEESRQQSSPAPKLQASAASGSGCLGSFLTVLFCLGGIGLCFATDSVGAKILFIFGGLALALLSAYFCGLFGNKPTEAKVEKDTSKISIDKKKLIKRVSIISAILVVIVLLCNIGNMKNAHYYRLAINLINACEYEKAQDSLSEIEGSNYKEESELYVFCSALENYEKGQRVNGPDYKYVPYDFNFKFNDDIEAKKLAINKQLEKQAEEYKQKTYNNLYDSIWNKSSEKETTTSAPTTRKSYSSGGGKSRSKSKTVDPYDVNNYSNEEDFYYDHYDDFFDYYEAEDYFNDNHD